MPDAPAASPAPASAAPAQQAAPTSTAGASPAAQPAATTTPTTTQTQTAPATAPAAGGEAKPATTPAETKPQEAKADPAKPYDLKLSDKATIDSAIATELAALAHKAGISQEHAQAFADFMDAKAASFVDQIKQAQVQAHENQVKTWDEALKADKEIGGEKVAANLEQGRRALERFADKEAIDFLRETGLNSNPLLARIFVRIGKAMGEDRIAAGKTGTEANDLRSIYKSMPNA